MTETSGYDLDAAKRYWRGDRDQAAKDANAAYSRQQRAQAGEDVRSRRVGTQLSEQEGAALDARLRELGIAYESEYVRDLILKDLGIEDMARRPTPKRPRRKQQREDGTQ